MHVLAHRGDPNVAPENTLISYSIARGLCAGIQTDVRLNGDGVPGCIHDSAIERTAKGRGLVRSYPLKELKHLDYDVEGICTDHPADLFNTLGEAASSSADST